MSDNAAEKSPIPYRLRQPHSEFVDNAAADLIEQQAAEIERLKQVLAENADLRDMLNDTQCDLKSANEMLAAIRRKELEAQILVTRFGELAVFQLGEKIAYVDSGPDGTCIAGVAGAYDDAINGDYYDTREAAEQAARDWLADLAMEGESK